jgi:GNAT superfamily N-acetyltransferase
MRVVELITTEEVRQAYPIMKQLRTHLDEDGYLQLLAEMAAQGYRLLALVDDGEIVALAGIALLTNLYYGRHVWVYDLVTDDGQRSRGYGLLLLDHVEAFAREHQCECIALSSGLQRGDAHRFYEEKAGYTRVSYAFRKSLNGVE